MKRLIGESSLIRFEIDDETLPEQYIVEFLCRGLAQRDQVAELHRVHIYLPAEYPRLAPGIRFKTPVFHPNIKAMLDDSEDIERLAATVGGMHNLQMLYSQDPNVRELFEAHVCLDVLALNWTPAVTLSDICIELGAMIQYQRFNVDDPLNHDAAEWARWARTQPGLLPVGDRQFQRPQPKVSDLPIRILKTERVPS